MRPYARSATNSGSPDTHLVTPGLSNLPEDERTNIVLCEVARKEACLMQTSARAHSTFFQK